MIILTQVQPSGGLALNRLNMLERSEIFVAKVHSVA